MARGGGEKEVATVGSSPNQGWAPFQRTAERARAMDTPAQKRVLNAGSGVAFPGRLHEGFRGEEWSEVRLDIDPRTQPDVVGSMCDMRGIVPDASFDAVWSSHSLEHLYAHEVDAAFREFRRILKTDGFVLATCPDIAAVANLILQHGLEADIYQSAAGPIKPLDMLYGHGRSIGAGQLAMSHRTGFTAERLGRLAIDCGFAEARIVEGLNYDLWALLAMPETDVARAASLFDNTNVGALLSAGLQR
jgi:SAM-dependent methyltransferase